MCAPNHCCCTCTHKSGFEIGGKKNPHSKKRAVWIKQILANKDQLIAVTGFQHFVLALTILIFAVLLSFDFPSRHCSIALSSAARLY